MRHLFFVLITIATLTTCVDPIDFKIRKEADLLVVDGSVSDSDGPHTVRLSRTDALGRSDNFPPVPGAQVTLVDETLGNEVAFNETGAGEYQLFYHCYTGNTYRLKITLIGGEKYESLPETMPEPIAIDSTYSRYEQGKFAAAYCTFKIPENITGPYLKWQVENIYQVTEIYCGPFDPINTCYISRSRDNQLLPVVDGSKLQRNTTYHTFLQKLYLDNTFGEATYFNIWQESLTQDAFLYWSKVSQLLLQGGSIFDSPPGAIRGNIINTGNPNELVLGYFSAAPVRIAHLKTTRGDFPGAEINPYCGAAGFPPYPFKPECCTCTLIKSSTLERPDYW